MDYVFSADPLVAHLYPGCTGPDLANNYLCGELTLIEGDTVKIDRLGSTIRFGGQVTLGANTTINKGGQSADLTLGLGGICKNLSTASLLPRFSFNLPQTVSTTQAPM